MKRLLPLSLALLCLGTLGACSITGRPSGEAGSVVAERKIETRDQLLFAVNAWMKEHHQPEWTLAELIGRVVDQAFAFRDYGPRLKPPVESFVVCLIKNRQFTHAIKLRTDWRDEIKLRTERPDVIREQAELKRAIKNRWAWRVETKLARFPRRLPLPRHATLSLDILATPAEIRDKDENPEKLTHWGIFLAYALAGEKQRAKTSGVGHSHVPEFVASPQQLLDAINADRREIHQPALTLDEITVRAADEAFAMKDFGRDLGLEVELFLECLAKNRRFIYPMRMSGGGAEGHKDIEVYSTKEQLLVPPHSYLSIDILDFPWDAVSEENPVEIDFTTIILSYAFPAEKGKAKAKQTSRPATR